MQALRSWIPSADDPRGDFPIQNLPLGVFTRADSAERPSIGVAIGDRILDLRRCGDARLLRSLPAEIAAACGSASLNRLMALGRDAGARVRQLASELLCTDIDAATRTDVEKCLLPAASAQMQLPAVIGDYTDFYASLYHAQNVGTLLRPDATLPPNFPYIPLAYHGRASSIVVSGTTVQRPTGQVRDRGATAPRLARTAALDYEAEVAFFIGGENPLGEPVPIDVAESRLFGVCLLNDWSARDMQAWESQPLGPFLSKSFATTISPWIVLMDALEAFRTPASTRPTDHPEPLSHLDSRANRERGGIDLTLDIALASAAMRRDGHAPVSLGRTHLRGHYWTAAQMVTHHASNGCNLRPGDLIATGTVSGPDPGAHGCLLELTRRGAAPVPLVDGEQRAYLEDGDEVVIRGYCEREGHVRIGFGECRGQVVGE
jgi:fumarylacetoacetase